MSVIGSNDAINAAYTSTTGTDTTQSTRSKSSPTVDYTQFLQLLVAEMRNQDPTDPADPTEHISQLASFSAVEQQVRTNSILGIQLVAQADHLIGRTLTSADGLTQGVVVSVTSSADNQVSVTLQDGSTIVLGAGITIGSS